MKHVLITEFLTQKEIELAMKLETAKKICEQIIQPNIERINKAIGQECDAMYLSYMVEHVVSEVNRACR